MSLFILALTLAPQPAHAIYNGVSPARDHALAVRTVLLLGKLNGGREGTCTGTLLADNLILTAGHCAPKILETAEVSFAADRETAFADPSSRKPISHWQAHERFLNAPSAADRKGFDIALMKFTGELPAGYQPFVISPSPLPAGAEFSVSGFGLVAQTILEGGGLFRTTTYPANALVNAPSSPELQFDQSTTGACQGDSGGPLSIEENGQLRVVGLVSRPLGTNVAGEAIEPKDYCKGIGLFTNVQNHYEWIRETSLRFLTQSPSKAQSLLR